MEYGGIMKRRLKSWKLLCLISLVFFTLVTMFDGGHIVLDSWKFFQHHLYLNSFTSHITILNSSSSTSHNSQVLPYPYPYRFLVNQPEKCLTRRPFLVLLVMAESYDVKARDSIRKTWGNLSNYEDVDILRIFLVGISPLMTGTIQKLLEEESTIYGDIVQQDFLDTYNNLTLKTLMGMEWVTKFCPNASYVMKIDSDVFLNVNYLVHHLLHPELPPQSNYITGFIVRYTGPIRDVHSKWYVNEGVYPGDTYPPYPSGPGYVFSVDMARKIYEVAQNILVFGIEDAFVGICLYKLKISPTNSPENVFRVQKINYNPKTFCNLVIVHHYKGDDLIQVWDDFWMVRTIVC
ncbi:beta-1,3-galactosyltransferase 2-like isoform X2 [Engystomops pustulosus]|uniref:beta-1,3-galactosyltransferase 2-like isoform X2 n=1 Tax=Engystomops pustulosus TaxID=76066 RepID=UPI003AFA5C55